LELRGLDGMFEPNADLPVGMTAYVPLFALTTEGRILKSEQFDQPTRISSVEELAETIPVAPACLM